MKWFFFLQNKYRHKQVCLVGSSQLQDATPTPNQSVIMNLTNYINANGQEIIVCKGGWKISREKMEANKIKRLVLQEKAKADRKAFLRAKIDAAISRNDNEEVDYLRFMYSM
jgi:hypothetical protein